MPEDSAANNGSHGPPQSAETWPRIAPTSGIHNFRDFGGYRAAGNAHLPLRTLYRSGEPARPTESDLALVTRLNLTSAIDLRGNAERARAPAVLPEKLSASVVHAEGETSLPPHIAAAIGAVDAATARRTMNDRYAVMPFARGLIGIYRRYFSLLLNSTGPTLVFCAAGKDRTGLLVALVHTALGVHRDDVFQDYLLTNSAGDPEARIAALRTEIRYRFGNLSEEAIRVVASVEPQFLQTALDAIGERYGGIEQYLEQALGVSATVRAALMARLLA